MCGMLERSVGILLAITVGAAVRAEQPDHLVPAGTPGLGFGAYSQELDRAFDLGGTQAWGGVVVMPSFSGESVVWLRSTPTGPEVEIRTADAYIWSARVLLRPGAVKREVTVRTQRAAISLATYRALQDAWEVMLQRVDEPEADNDGRDGTTYWFFRASDDRAKRLTGSTWSPSPDGLPGRLVRLAHDLSRLAKATPEESGALDAEIRTAAERLARDANAPN